MRWLLVLAIGASCRNPPSTALDVTVLRATAVEATDGGQRWWFFEPDAPVVVVSGVGTAPSVEARWADGRLAAASEERVDGGVRLSLERPALGAHVLTVRSGQTSRALSLIFTPSTTPVAERLSAAARERPGEVDALLASLAGHEWVTGCVAVAREAPLDERIDAYLGCATGADARGFVSEAFSRRIAAFFWARRLGRLGRARQIQALLEADAARLPDVRLLSQFHYQHAVFLADLGDPRSARLMLEKAIAEADAALRPDERALYEAYLAVVLSDAGRHQEALALASSLERAGAGLSVGDALALRSNLSWVKLRAFVKGMAVDGRTLHAELTALAASTEATGNAVDTANVLANLAAVEWRLSLTGAGTTVLRARKLLGPTVSGEAVFLDWLEGRLALSRGDAAGALEAFEAMQQRAQASAPGVATDGVWRAQLGRAEALLMQRKKVEAVRALAEARKALSAQARHFSEPGERVALFEDRRTAIADAVDAFVRANACEAAWRLADDGQAWLARSFETDRRVRLALVPDELRTRVEAEEEAYRRARERALAEAPPRLGSVAEVTSWKAEHQRTLEALREQSTKLSALVDTVAPLPRSPPFEPKDLTDGEALLELFDTGTTVHAFLVDAKGVRCGQSLQDVTHAPSLSRVRHLYVAGGEAFDLSLLPSFPERMSVSLVPSAAWLGQPSAPRAASALVVGDPRRDLPHARAEARAVAASLGAELLLGDDATLKTVTEKWRGRGVVHFAGHGRLSAEAPWDARLELARGQSLDFESLLSTRLFAWLVVLSGCSTGAAARAPADGIGLAQGFLASGANAVLATTTEVPDDAAARFVERFYRLGGAQDPVEAYRRAVLEARSDGDDAWRTWRLFGRRPRR